MLESRRQAYLQALGIGSWVSRADRREQVAGAKPAPLLTHEQLGYPASIDLGEADDAVIVVVAVVVVTECQAIRQTVNLHVRCRLAQVWPINHVASTVVRQEGLVVGRTKCPSQNVVIVI